MARVAGLSFGGPAGQIAVMHRILVEEKRWVCEERVSARPQLLHAAARSRGPAARHLHRLAAAPHARRISPAACSCCPGFSPSWPSATLRRLGNVPIIVALFFGLKAAVLAVVVEAVVRIGRRALKNRVMVALAAAAFVGIFFLNVPFPLIIFARGADRLRRRSRRLPPFRPAEATDQAEARRSGRRREPARRRLPEHHARPSSRALRVSAVWLALWLIPVSLLLWLGADNVFSQIAVFFSKTAMVTFGGAYAVLAYVAQQAVEHYGWLKPGEMLDGLGMAETTPGPLIMVLQFVGFMAAFRHPGALSPMLAGTLGGLLATWVTFTPCFLWIFLGAPFIETLRGNKALSAALSAITAAVVGVVLNLAIWFAIHTVFRQTVSVQTFPFAFEAPIFTSVDPWALLLSLAAAIAVFRFKIGMLPTLAACCLVGIGLYVVGAIA